MRRFLPLIMLFGLLSTSGLFAQDVDVEFRECISKTKSCIDLGTTPQPFQELAGPNQKWFHDEPAISTGYYFVTNNSVSADFWRPRSSDLLRTDDQPERWITVMPGPRIKDPAFWDSQENEEGGYWFFRNPASNGGNVFDFNPNAIIDSTDEAIAGPMRLGISGGFRFNGIRYDSFYVSTNGLIALTNRRYVYNPQTGARIIDDQTGDAYDRESMDWYHGPTMGRGRSGDGLNDNTPDNYGYRFAVLGGNPASAQGGIRSRGPNPVAAGLTDVSNPYRAAVIAPVWGDFHLSQFQWAGGFIDPHGKVMYRRSEDAQRLHINIENIAPKSASGFLPSPCGNYTNNQYQNTNTLTDLRFSDVNYTSVTTQVILSNTDSSVTIIYDRILGNIQNGNCQTEGKEGIRYNSTAGVRGFARHDNFNRANDPDPTPEYEQYTHHWVVERVPNRPYPRTQLAVKYKQWQNTLRVVDIQYRVRNPTITQFPDLRFTEVVRTSQVNNYELLAGEERLGAIQPVALIQNLSNDIQGSRGANYVKQDLEFRARFRIINQASGRPVRQNLVAIDSSCMALPEDRIIECVSDPNVRIRLVEVEIDRGDYIPTEYVATADDPNAQYNFPGDGSDTPSGNPLGGVPPYGFVKVNFPPFEPSEFIDNDIGRLRAFVIAVPNNADNPDLGDEWPFDDQTAVNLFVLRRLRSFYDDGNEFHLINGVPMPSVWKWVNIGAQMANGNQVSKHPLPPRGRFTAQFVDSPPQDRWEQPNIDAASNFQLTDPVIRMNRKTIADQEHENPSTTVYGGDEIRSFPIDMRGRENSVLSVSFQRTTYDEDWERGWNDSRLVGPEPRVLRNNNALNPYIGALSASQRPDEIVVELANNFVDDAEDKLEHVTNIGEQQWRRHFRRDGAPAESGMPAFALYGAGGYRVGFLESDPDSALAPPTTADRNGLRPNIYDDGIDEEYQRFFVAIPDTFVNFPHEVAENFRFRIKVMATNDQKPIIPAIPDDDDDFYVDNVRILFEDVEATDIEVNAVKVKWPYTRVPATQATKVPVSVKVTNNTSSQAPTYFIKLRIFKGQGAGFDSEPIYCRLDAIGSHNPRIAIEHEMPSFNAKDAGPGNYRLEAIVLLPNDTDRDSRNDTTYFDWSVEFGDDFAYDPIDDGNETNNISNNLGKPRGRGLNLYGAASGGGYFGYGTYNNTEFGAGVTGGSGSGQIAMKFRLSTSDTLYGYKAFFGTNNQEDNDIQFQLYEGGTTPGQEIAEATINRERGISDVLVDNQGNPLRQFGEYVDFRLEEGVVLQPGEYWISISQMGQTGLELGGSISRGGMRVTNVYLNPPFDPPGQSGIHLNIHKDFRTLNATRDRFVNDNLFAMENSKGSNQWVGFMNTVGNSAYAHLHHLGYSPVDRATETMSRGFWIPFLRPFFGEKAFGENPPYEECPDIPVELAYFNGNPVANGLELYWETASEENNKGFYIERKLASQESEADWRAISFVDGLGAGNHAVGQAYSFIDNNVEPGVLYNYRLKQVDIDGTHDCQSSGIVTLQWNRELQLSVTTEAYPNPFNEVTKFEIYNPQDGFVTVQIFDSFGNIVKTLYDNDARTGTIPLTWDGTTETGAKVAQGTYIYRVSTDEGTLSNKINYIAK